MTLKIPHAAPNGLIAAVFLAFLATAGLFYVNIMAAIVDGLVNGLGLTTVQAGRVGSANIYGAAFGALTSVLFVKRVPWKPLAYVCLISLIIIDLLSTKIGTYSVLLPVRLGHGIIGGILTGTAFAVIARTANPDRSFGMLLFGQFGLGGLAYYQLPQLTPIYGSKSLFIALAIFSLATLAMLPFLDKYPVISANDNKAGRIRMKPFLLTLGAIFLFQAANMGLFAYIFTLGLEYGLDRTYMSKALWLATWVALAGPFLVMTLGQKFGRFWLMFIAMGLTLAGTALFHYSAKPWAYFVANCATGITWGFVIAYLFGMSAEFDKAGRATAFAGFVSKIGLASGPLIAGWVLEGKLGYSGMLNFALIVFFLGMLVMLIPARILDKGRNKA
ncbi:MAG TPA: MFS transporter [Hellea balneolensis]|uniref:MFS transporter n=1 Tax=Hellea balneolensis TaxID=287478 RepID=A0A7C3GCH0_9PROT|nr:MFS transporter [Hellea balneolensis]